ncbi:MAG: hypothetical protein HZB15_08085 [Actinobacteria bacterium]|nr:hypothetical protein [Actinomycetota bacterium]
MAPLTTSAGRLAGGVGSWLRRAVRVRSSDSPTQLQAAAVLTVVCALALSVAGWYSIDRRESAIVDASGAAGQLIRVQDVRVLLVQADSIASNAYLEAGQESSEQRQEYEDRIAEATGRLIESANAASGTDVADLRAVSAQLATYVGLVEQARSNNRQGFPVGAAYQRQARGELEQLVGSLRVIEQRARTNVNDSVDDAHRAGWLLVVSAALLLVVLAVGSVWLARRWHRMVNVPLAVAGLITIVVLTAGAGANHRAMSRSDDIVSTPLAAADLLAQARAAGFDARSNEALTLIARGNGQAYETQWGLSASVVDTALRQACKEFEVGCAAGFAWTGYASSHRAVRGLDDDGSWDAAVDAVIDVETDPLEIHANFGSFTRAAESALGISTAAATDGFDDATSSLRVLRILVALAGLVVAVLAFAGYGQRLREYR